MTAFIVIIVSWLHVRVWIAQGELLSVGRFKNVHRFKYDKLSFGFKIISKCIFFKNLRLKVVI